MNLCLFEELPNVFPYIALHLEMHEGSGFPSSFLTLDIVCIIDCSHSGECVVVSHCVFLFASH